MKQTPHLFRLMVCPSYMCTKRVMSSSIITTWAPVCVQIDTQLRKGAKRQSFCGQLCVLGRRGLAHWEDKSGPSTHPHTLCQQLTSLSYFPTPKRHVLLPCTQPCPTCQVFGYAEVVTTATTSAQPKSPQVRHDCCCTTALAGLLGVLTNTGCSFGSA